MELRPLEELVVVDRLLEGLALDEVVLAALLARAPRSGRPTPREPQVIVGLNEALSNRPFAHATGTYENDD